MKLFIPLFGSTELRVGGYYIGKFWIGDALTCGALERSLEMMFDACAQSYCAQGYILTGHWHSPGL
jgi:hypothetical protein